MNDSYVQYLKTNPQEISRFAIKVMQEASKVVPHDPKTIHKYKNRFVGALSVGKTNIKYNYAPTETVTTEECDTSVVQIAYELKKKNPMLAVFGAVLEEHYPNEIEEANRFEAQLLEQEEIDHKLIQVIDKETNKEILFIAHNTETYQNNDILDPEEDINDDDADLSATFNNNKATVIKLGERIESSNSAWMKNHSDKELDELDDKDVYSSLGGNKLRP